MCLYPFLGETQTRGDAGRPSPHPPSRDMRGISTRDLPSPLLPSHPLPNQMPQCKRTIVLTVVTSLDGRAACTMAHTCIIARVSRRSSPRSLPPSLSLSLSLWCPSPYRGPIPVPCVHVRRSAGCSGPLPSSSPFTAAASPLPLVSP